MSYLKKMFRNNLIICLCYTLLFSALMLIFTIKITSTEIDNSSQNLIYQVADYIDNAISKSLDSTIIINNNSYVKDYANETEPNYYNRKMVHAFIRNSIGYLPGKNSIVAVTHYNDKSVIANDSTMYFDTFAKELGTTVAELERLMASANAASSNSIHYIISDNRHESILTLLTCERDKYKQPLYIFVGLRMDDLTDIFQKPDMNLLISADNEILYASADTPDSLKTAVASGSIPKNYRFYSQNSSVSRFLGNMTYYSLIPKTLYMRNLSDKFMLLSVIFVMLFIICLAVVYLATKRTYAPIAGLLNAINAGNSDKNNNEIDYIKNKILGLSQQNEQLNTILDKYRTPLEEAFLRDLLYGSISETAANEKLRQYCICSDGLFITAVTETSTDEIQLENVPESSINVLNRTISGMFCENFSNYSYFRILKLSPNRYALIASIKSLDDFKRELRRFFLKTSENTGINMFASLGTVVNDIRRLSTSFSVALNVAQNRVYSRQNQMLCTPDDVSGFMGGSVYYPFDTEAAIIESAANGDIEALHSHTRMLIYANFIHKSFSAEQFSQFIFMFTSTFNRIFSALNKNCSDIFPEDMIIYLELKSCHEPDELLNKINSLLDEIVNSVQKQITSMDSRNREIMLEFIENNYTRDISLLDLAEYMNFSSVYTSKLFKLLVGQNFKEYLTRLRFEKAKELMTQNPNMKIKDISIAVGCNATILSRCFVKFTGMSAGQFQKKIQR